MQQQIDCRRMHRNQHLIRCGMLLVLLDDRHRCMPFGGGSGLQARRAVLEVQAGHRGARAEV
jgi:hypothetical protein